MAFVQSKGKMTTVASSAVGSYWSAASAPMAQLGPATWQTYSQIWRSQPALRTVVGFLARNVAQLGLDVFRRVSDVDRVKDPDHPLALLLENPWPGSKWTKYRLLNWLVHELCIYDNAYLVKMPVDGGLALLPVPCPYVVPLGNNPLMAQGYRLYGRTDAELPPDAVAHFHGYNPDRPREGDSPIETLRGVLAEEHSAQHYREQMWRNGARVSGYISRPKEAPRWSADGRDRFKAEWQELYAGNGPMVGAAPVLEEGMNFHPSGVTPRDAQYVESRKLTRLEVGVAYYVPPAMLGVLDEQGSKANIGEQHKMLYQDCLGPTLVQISQDFERQVLGDVDPVGAASRGVYVEFNLAEKLRGSFAEQAAAIQSAVGAPWMTRSEARAMHNLRHLDTADELVVPLNVLAGGLASPNDTAPDNPSNSESNDLPAGPKPAAARPVGAGDGGMP